MIPVSSPYDFGLYPKLFVHGEHIFLPFRYSPTRWSRLIDINDENSIPVSVTCEYSPEPKLRITFMGDVPTTVIRILESRLADCFCAGLDLEPLYEMASTYVRLKHLFNELNGLRPHLSLDPFESLIKVIVRQVVRATTAQKLIDNLVRRFGNSMQVEEDTYFSFPTPRALAEATKSELLDCKIGYKWSVIRKLSREVVRGNLDFDSFQQLKNDEIVSILMEYKWIGPWTSRVFLYDGLHRLDAYPEFDISIKRATTHLRLRGLVNEFVYREASDIRQVWGVMVSYLFGSLWTNNLTEQDCRVRSKYS
jgi:DNA-3-methyladenine glycosylase II